MSQYRIIKLKSEIAGLEQDILDNPETSESYNRELLTLERLLEAEQKQEEKHQKWMNDREGT